MFLVLSVGSNVGKTLYWLERLTPTPSWEFVRLLWLNNALRLHFVRRWIGRKVTSKISTSQLLKSLSAIFFLFLLRVLGGEEIFTSLPFADLLFVPGTDSGSRCQSAVSCYVHNLTVWMNLSVLSAVKTFTAKRKEKEKEKKSKWHVGRVLSQSWSAGPPVWKWTTARAL